MVEGVAAELSKAVQGVDQSVRILGQGLIVLGDQQTLQVDMLRRIADTVKDNQTALADIQSEVCAPAPPSPIVDLLSKLTASVEAIDRRLERIEQHLSAEQ